MSPLTLEIHPLTRARKSDFFAFFEGEAFADNAKWNSCFCQFLYVDHNVINWQDRTFEQNRVAACDRIDNCRMQGHLAYLGGKPVGWCNAAPRTMMDAFFDEPDKDESQLGQITCFVIAKAHRRTGIATSLLLAACDALKAQGLTIAEASPLADASDDARNHFGPLNMYLNAGFHVHKTLDEGKILVRKNLA
jgi:GNAT superfamily N-acetyltransferase